MAKNYRLEIISIRNTSWTDCTNHNLDPKAVEVIQQLMQVHQIIVDDTLVSIALLYAST